MKQAATLFLPFFLMTPGLCLTSAAPQQLQIELSHTPEILDTTKTVLTDGHIPVQSLYQLLAAEMALDREHPEIALANYIAAAKETQDPKVAARATQIALTIASLEVAIEPAVIWAKADPSNLEAQITTAALYIRMNQIQEALPYLRHSEQVNQEDALQYYLILYRQLQKEEDSKRVVEALQLVAKDETKEIAAHLALAEIYLFQGDNAQALQMSEKALKINPSSSNAIQFYAEAILRTKGKEEAKVFLDKSASSHPDAVLLKQYYAQFLLENGYEKEARHQVSQLIENPKLTSQELLQFSRLCMQARWFDLADITLKRASKFDESKDLSYYFLARSAEMQNHINTAIQWYQQVLTGPFHVLSQIRASTLLTEARKYDDALTILSRIHANDPGDHKQISLATVDVLNKAKRYQESLKLLDENLKETPNDLDLHYARSLVADELNHIDIAETDLKAILILQPNHIDALNALGYLLANKTKRFDEAQKYLSQALSLSPNNASILDSMGWLYYKMGNYPKSVEMLQKASDILPDAEIAAHLGEVLWQMKDYDAAKKVWNTALEQYPKHENIVDTMKRVMKK